MDFKEPYLLAMKERAPKMYSELVRNRQMLTHLDERSRAAHEMLAAILADEPRNANGNVKDGMAEAIAREIVYAELIQFEEDGLPGGRELRDFDYDENEDFEPAPYSEQEEFDHEMPGTASAPAPTLAAAPVGDQEAPYPQPGSGQAQPPTQPLLAGPRPLEQGPGDGAEISDWELFGSIFRRWFGAPRWFVVAITLLAFTAAMWAYPHAAMDLGGVLLESLIKLSVLASILCVTVFLPLGFVRPVREFARRGFRLAAWIFGLTLWFYSWGVVDALWGHVAATVGVALGFIAVEPMAMIAAVTKYNWPGALDLLLLGVSWIGAWLMEWKVAGWQAAPRATTPKASKAPKATNELTEGAMAVALSGVFIAFWGAQLAAWVTHIVYCAEHHQYDFMLTGLVVFPVGVIHGWGLWFGWFH